MEGQDFRLIRLQDLDRPAAPIMAPGDLFLTALTLLIGEEGRDYLALGRDAEAWGLLGWIRRN